MKKRDLELQFVAINTEFKIIKKLIYIILAALIGLLLKAYWDNLIKVPEITGNVVKSFFS